MIGVLSTLRPRFLVLAPACVAVGVAAAGAAWSDPRVWLAVTGAVAAHAAVNGFNEVLDLRSGLDLRTARTPFSGGSGALPRNPELVPATLGLALIALAVAVCAGLLLVLASGPGLLLYGFAGVFLVMAYTPSLNRRPLVCLLAPGIGFGPVMVAGTAFALTGSHSGAAWAASAVPFALASGLLLVNQVPDREPDREAGRRHLVVVHGTRVVAPVYLALIALGFGTLAAAVAAGVLPRAALIALAALPFALLVAWGLHRHHADVPALLPWMGLNTALTVLTPVLLAGALSR